MSEFLRNYLTVAIFGGLSVALLAGVLGLGSLVRPSRPQPGKHLNYVDEDKRRRIDGDEFEQRLEAVLNRLNLTDTHPGNIVVNAR